MTLLRGGYVLMVLVAISILTFVFIRSQTIDPDRHYRITDRLRLLKQYDAILSQDTLKLRANLLGHYDSLVESLDQISGLIADLEAGPVAIVGKGRPEIDRLVENYARAHAERRKMLERFKKRNATLRNSLLYFPSAIEKFLEGIKNQSEYERTFRSLEILSRDVLVDYVDKSSGLHPRLQSRIDMLVSLSDRMPSDVGEQISSLISHARIIISHKREVSEILKVVLSGNMSNIAEKIYDSYQTQYVSSQKKERIFTFLLYMSSVLLMACIINVLFRLAQATHRLSQANETLERRVEARTKELTQEIIERKRVEAAAREHQEEMARVLRINMMGEMASALAHEINQPLTAIMNYARGCLLRIRAKKFKRDEFGSAIEEICAQAERASKVVHHMREFVKKPAFSRKPMDLNELVVSAAKFAEIELRHSEVRVEFDLAERLPAVPVDSIQIEQVILNLIRNSIDAMQELEVTSRLITIRTSTNNGNGLDIAVCDIGSGVPDSIAEKIFDPFFTTKSQGVGMGLAISRTIVEAHSGRLWNTSNSGRGATFGFTIPYRREGESHVL